MVKDPEYNMGMLILVSLQTVKCFSVCYNSFQHSGQIQLTFIFSENRVQDFMQIVSLKPKKFKMFSAEIFIQHVKQKTMAWYKILTITTLSIGTDRP